MRSGHLTRPAAGSSRRAAAGICGGPDTPVGGYRQGMPVIVIGADTPEGRAVVEQLMVRAIEVRAFVSDPDAVGPLRALGAKVATGDVSDGSHVEAAAMRCFCAVVLAGAAADDRARAFATTPGAVADTWLDALRGAGITRLLWVDDPRVPVQAERLAGAGRERAVLQPGPDLAERIAELENAESIG